MLDMLEKLRSKPIAHRKRVLLLTAGSITGLIFIIWLSTFTTGIASESVDGATVEKTLGPIENLKNNFAYFYDSAKKLSGEIFGYGATTTPNQASR